MPSLLLSVLLVPTAACGRSATTSPADAGATTTAAAAATLALSTVAESSAAATTTPTTRASPPASGTGTTFAHTIWTHCGIEWTQIGGGWWRTVPLDDGHGNPPPGWDRFRQEGTMTITAPDGAVFVDTEGRSLLFWPAAAGEAPPGCA